MVAATPAAIEGGTTILRVFYLKENFKKIYSFFEKLCQFPHK
jgi:hypothetical protein